MTPGINRLAGRLLLLTLAALVLIVATEALGAPTEVPRLIGLCVGAFAAAVLVLSRREWPRCLLGFSGPSALRSGRRPAMSS